MWMYKDGKRENGYEDVRCTVCGVSVKQEDGEFEYGFMHTRREKQDCSESDKQPWVLDNPVLCQNCYMAVKNFMSDKAASLVGSPDRYVSLFHDGDMWYGQAKDIPWEDIKVSMINK